MKSSSLVVHCVLVSIFALASSASFAEAMDTPYQLQSTKSCSFPSFYISSQKKCSVINSSTNTKNPPILSQTSYSGSSKMQGVQSVQSTEKDALALLIEELAVKYPPTPVAIEK